MNKDEASVASSLSLSLFDGPHSSNEMAISSETIATPVLKTGATETSSIENVDDICDTSVKVSNDIENDLESMRKSARSLLSDTIGKIMSNAECNIPEMDRNDTTLPGCNDNFSNQSINIENSEIAFSIDNNDLKDSDNILMEINDQIQNKTVQEFDNQCNSNNIHIKQESKDLNNDKCLEEPSTTISNNEKQINNNELVNDVDCVNQHLISSTDLPTDLKTETFKMPLQISKCAVVEPEIELSTSTIDSFLTTVTASVTTMCDTLSMKNLNSNLTEFGNDENVKDLAEEIVINNNDELDLKSNDNVECFLDDDIQSSDEICKDGNINKDLFSDTINQDNIFDYYSQQVSPDLFMNVKFSLCENVPDLDKIKKIMVGHGGKFFNYLTDSATHFIANDSEHPSVSEAIDIFEKPVVTSQWVWLSLRANKMLPIEPFLLIADDNGGNYYSRLFSKIIACPSQLSINDCKRLWSMITYYGGRFQLQLDSCCTHLFTTKISGKKYDIAHENKGIKIVTPDWVVDSIRQRKLCNEQRYHPRLLFNYQDHVNYQNKCASKPIKTEENSNSCSTSINTTSTITKSVTMTISTEAVTVRKSNDPALGSIYQQHQTQQQLSSPKLAILTPQPVTTASTQLSLQSLNIKPIPALNSAITPQSATNCTTNADANSQMNSTVPPQQYHSNNNNNNNSQQHAPSSLPYSLLASKQPINQNYSMTLQRPQNTITTVSMMTKSSANTLPQHRFQISMIQQPNVQHQQYSQIRNESVNTIKSQINAQQKIVGASCNEKMLPRTQLISSQQQLSNNYQQHSQGNQISYQQSNSQIVSQQPRQGFQQSNSQMYQQQSVNQQQFRGQYVQISSGQRTILQQRPQLLPQINSQQQMTPQHVNANQYRQQFINQNLTYRTQQAQQIAAPTRQQVQQQYQRLQGPNSLIQINSQPKMTRMVQPCSATFNQNYAMIDLQQNSQQQSQLSPNISQQQGQRIQIRLATSGQQQIINQLPTGHSVPISAGGQTISNYSQTQQQSKPIRQSIMIHNNGHNGQPQMMQSLVGMKINNPNVPYMSQTQSQQQQIVNAMDSKVHIQPAPPQQQQIMNHQQIQQIIRQQQQSRWVQQISTDYNDQHQSTSSQQQQYQTRPLQTIHIQQTQGQVQPAGQHSQAWIRQPIQHSSGQQHRFQQHNPQMVRMVSTPVPNPSPFYETVINNNNNNNKVRANMNHTNHNNNQQPQSSQDPMAPSVNNNAVVSPQFSGGGSEILPSAKTILLSSNSGTSIVSTNSVISNQSTGTGISTQTPINTTSVVKEKTKTALTNLLNNRFNLQQQQQQILNSNSSATSVLLPNRLNSSFDSLSQQSSTSTTCSSSVSSSIVSKISIQQQAVVCSDNNVTSGTTGANLMIPNHANYHSDQMIHQDVRHNTPHHVQSSNQTGGSFVHKSHLVSSPLLHSTNLSQTPTHQPEHYHNTHQTAQFPFVSPISGKPALFCNSSSSSSAIVQSHRPVINHYPLPSTTAAGHLSQPQLQSFTSSQSQLVSQQSSSTNHPLPCSLHHGSIIQTTPPPVQQQIRFYGHELKPSISISSECCLIGCVFYISPTYSKNQNTENLISGWKRSIIKFGAKIVDNLQSEITHIVTEYIDLKSKPDIEKRYVSIFWLNEVLEKGQLLPPWRFYHLPLTFNPQSAPCKHHLISITNFNQRERSMIKHLIQQTGARYTDYLTQKNTILICKTPQGKKYKKAVEWRLIIVNISWLQDILFGNNDIIFMGNLPKKYKIFESKFSETTSVAKNSSLSEKTQLINRGTFKVDYSLITDLMAPWRVPIKFDDEELRAHEKKICDDQTNKIKDNDKLVEKDKVKLNLAMLDDKNTEKFVKSEDSFKNDQEKKRSLEENSESPLINGVIDLKYQNIDNIGPPPLKRIKQEVDNGDNDNDSPHMNDALILKEKSSDEDAVITLLMNNIEEENSCLTNDSFLSTSNAINDSIVSSSGAVSLVNGNTNSENSNNSNNLECGSNGSIQKELDSQFKVPFDVRKLPSSDIVILLLGVHKKKDYEQYRSMIETLGGRIPLNTDDALKTTHLVISHEYHCMLPKLSIKFLCAFARAQFLVNIEWLNDSFKMEHFISELNYQYDDNEGGEITENLLELDNCNGERKEQKMSKITQKSLVFQFYSLDLCKSWKCRSENLFQNFIFMLTHSLIPMPVILKQIIQANGGQVVLKRLPNRRQLDALFIKNGQCSPPKIVIISCDNDLHLISDYLIKHPKVEILSSSFIIDAILKQKFDFRSFRLISTAESNQLSSITTNTRAPPTLSSQ